MATHSKQLCFCTLVLKYQSCWAAYKLYKKVKGNVIWAQFVKKVDILLYTYNISKLTEALIKWKRNYFILLIILNNGAF